MRALLHYAATPALRRALEALVSDWLQVDWLDERDEQGFASALPDIDVLLHVLRPVGATDIQRAARLKLIQKIGVGVNTIDLEAARARGVAVANMPGTNSRAVAEHALMLMLAALRRAPLLDRAVRAGSGWTFERAALDQVGELGGRCVGFVGFGSVPRLLAPACAALGSRVQYFAAHGPKPDVPWPFVALDELLETSDVLSLHVPLSPATARMIDRAALARMKPGTVLVNTARGELVDEAALAEALRSGRIAAAGLDVFEREPLRSDSPLLQLDNIVLTPHVAWLTPQTLGRSLSVAVENCRRLRDGEPLLHRVA